MLHPRTNIELYVLISLNNHFLANRTFQSSKRFFNFCTKIGMQLDCLLSEYVKNSFWQTATVLFMQAGTHILPWDEVHTEQDMGCSERAPSCPSAIYYYSWSMHDWNLKELRCIRLAMVFLTSVVPSES